MDARVARDSFRWRLLPQEAKRLGVVVSSQRSSAYSTWVIAWRSVSADEKAGDELFLRPRKSRGAMFSFLIVFLFLSLFLIHLTLFLSIFSTQVTYIIIYILTYFFTQPYSLIALPLTSVLGSHTT